MTFSRYPSASAPTPCSPTARPICRPHCSPAPPARPVVHRRSNNRPGRDGQRVQRRHQQPGGYAATPLGDLVTPTKPDGTPDPGGSFLQPGALTIYREQGHRMIAIKFDVRGRDLAGAKRAKAISRHRRGTYTVEWSGELQEMQHAEERLMIVVPIALAMILVLLYINFQSMTDVLIVLSNVIVLSLGGIWALVLTNTTFSVSAAVGFISIFGVGIMDGLILVSSFHHLRLQGKPMQEAVLQAASYRLRPVLMTMLTAIFGLLPAALSRHRRADATPVGHRRHLRHVDGPAADALSDASALRRVP